MSMHSVIVMNNYSINECQYECVRRITFVHISRQFLSDYAEFVSRQDIVETCDQSSKLSRNFELCSNQTQNNFKVKIKRKECQNLVELIVTGWHTSKIHELKCKIKNILWIFLTLINNNDIATATIAFQCAGV